MAWSSGVFGAKSVAAIEPAFVYGSRRAAGKAADVHGAWVLPYMLAAVCRCGTCSASTGGSAFSYDPAPHLVRWAGFTLAICSNSSY
jgi:hypothetical protein